MDSFFCITLSERVSEHYKGEKRQILKFSLHYVGVKVEILIQGNSQSSNSIAEGQDNVVCTGIQFDPESNLHKDIHGQSPSYLLLSPSRT